MIYTSIYGDKDKERDDILVMKGYDKFNSPVMNAKIYKILCHHFLEGTTIWIDGNIYPLVPEQKLIDEWLGDADIAVFEHNHKWRMHEEVQTLKRMFKRRTPWVIGDIEEQVAHYMKIGIPITTALSMCGMIIRRDTPRVRQFNERWWAEICRWSQRDQLSFPVIIKEFPDIKVNYVEGNIKNHPYLRYETHAHFNT